jgi:predicted transcriptional regulator
MAEKQKRGEKQTRIWAAIMLENDKLKQLDDLARDEERSRSAMMRRLLLRALAQNEKTA